MVHEALKEKCVYNVFWLTALVYIEYCTVFFFQEPSQYLMV